MKAQLTPEKRSDLIFSSSKADDRWITSSAPSAYQWWHFDAVSDDGTESVSIRFYDNYQFSKEHLKNGHREKVPAVKFTYLCSKGHKYSVIKRYPIERFYASDTEPECTIGDCSFYYNNADYGSGYYVKIDMDLPGGKKLSGGFEWLLIESDLRPTDDHATEGHFWNAVGLRADVSGRFSIFDRNGKCTESKNFRGTGYHDNKRDMRHLAGSIDELLWGRVHFADSTAVFHRHKLKDLEAETAKLLIYKNGLLRELDAGYEEQAGESGIIKRSGPLRIRLVTDENIRLKIKPLKVIHKDLFESTWLTEMTLTLRDGIPRRTLGLTEYSKPANFNKKLYRWLARLI